MKTLDSVLLSLSATSLLLGAASPAFAQPREVSPTDAIPVKVDALELSLGGTFAQGVGDLGGTMDSVRDVAGPGAGLELGIGRRLTPNLAIAAYGVISGFTDGRGSGDENVATWTAGIKADWHLAPTSAVDPWVSLGVGAKRLWIGERESLDGSLIGIELAKAQLGVDYRLSPTFAIGPVIGASATMYLQEDREMTSGYETLDDKGVNWTFTAGLLGRFDVFGTPR